MGLFFTQPSMVQTNAFQAPGWQSVGTAYGDSQALGYSGVLYFLGYGPDAIIVPAEYRDMSVLDRVEVVYATEAPRNITVEYEARLMYSPRNIT